MGMLIYRRRYQDGQTEQRDTKRQEVEAEQETKEINGYTVYELKEMAKNQGIEGYSSMKKSELVKALE